MRGKRLQVNLKQRSHWCIIFTICLGLPALTACGGESASATANQQPQPAGKPEAAATLAHTYVIGSEFTAELPLEQEMRLEVQENPYGLKEVFLQASKGSMHVRTAWADGQTAQKGRKLEEGFAFAMFAPSLDVAFMWEWEVVREKVHVRFVAMNDKQQILQGKERFRQSKARLEKEQTSDTTLPLDERIAGFARLWSEVKYNFVGFDKVPDLDWDRMLTEYLPRVEQAEQADAYHRVLQECLVRLKDGHTGVELRWETACPPLWVSCIEDKAIVTETLPEDAVNLLPPALKEEVANGRVAVGEEVVQIDGRTVAEVLESNIYPFISACTPQERDQKAFNHLLRGAADSRVVLQVKGLDGATRQVELTRSAYSRMPKAFFEHRDLGNGIDYVAIRSFETENIAKQFEALCGQLRDSKGLIIDVRDNGGGNSQYADAVVARLVDAPVQNMKWTARQHVSAFHAWGRPEKPYQGDSSNIEPASGARFLGPVVVLTGAGTMSSAENFVVALHAAKRATLVGEPTTGSTGQPLLVELPGNATARICTKRDTYPDGRKFVGVGVIPDVEVRPTQADIAAGRDPVLEEGIETLSAMVEKNGQPPRQS